MAGGGSMTAPATAPAAAESQLAYQVPAGWTQGQLTISRGGIQVRRNAAFEVQEGDKRAEITVTSLPAESNPILSNVNRWRQQIGLDPIAQEDLKRDAKQLSVGDLAADYVQLQAPIRPFWGPSWSARTPPGSSSSRETPSWRSVNVHTSKPSSSPWYSSPNHYSVHHHLDPPWQLMHYRRNVFPGNSDANGPRTGRAACGKRAGRFSLPWRHSGSRCFCSRVPFS